MCEGKCPQINWDKQAIVLASRSLASSKSRGIWSIYISSRIYPAIFSYTTWLSTSSFICSKALFLHTVPVQCMILRAAWVSQPPQTHDEETADREEAEKLDELPNWPMFLRSFSPFACECFQHVTSFTYSPQQQSNKIHYSLILYNLFSYPSGTPTPSWTPHLSWAGAKPCIVLCCFSWPFCDPEMHQPT